MLRKHGKSFTVESGVHGGRLSGDVIQSAAYEGACGGHEQCMLSVCMTRVCDAR